MPHRSFPRPESGLLIAFEGIDGTGKSTQARLLAEWLRGEGHEADVFPEPTRGPHGLELRRRMIEHRLDAQAEFELFLADRTENVLSNVLPLMERGGVAILDRFYISSMAYQGARGLDPEEIRIANERIAPRPDRVLLLTLSPEDAAMRIHAREADGPNLFEAQDYQRRVAAIFDALDWPQVVRIDASRPVDEIQVDVRAVVGDLLKEKSEQP